MAVGLISNSINLAWTPEMFKILNKTGSSENIIYKHKVFTLLYIVITIIAIIIFPKIFSFYAGDKYTLNTPVMIMILIAYLFRGSKSATNQLFFLPQKDLHFINDDRLHCHSISFIWLHIHFILWLNRSSCCNFGHNASSIYSNPILET